MSEKEFNEKLDAWLAENPPRADCPNHPGHPTTLDRGAILGKATVSVDGTLSFRHVYQPCEACLVDRLQERGVPPSLLHCTLDNWQPGSEEGKKQLEAVREFAKVQCGFLFLLGPVGTGKSHLAVGALRLGRGGLFIKQADLLRRLRATYRDDKAADPVEPCKTAGFLVLDEMGVSSGGRDEWPMLHEILDHRYCAMMPTVITSNLTWEELAGLAGDRLSDRFRECAYRVLTLTGESHRPVAHGRYFGE